MIDGYVASNNRVEKSMVQSNHKISSKNNTLDLSFFFVDNYMLLTCSFPLNFSSVSSHFNILLLLLLLLVLFIHASSSSSFDFTNVFSFGF